MQLLDAAGRLQSCRLLFVSPAQINFLLPDGLAPGLATLTVNLPGRQPAQTRLDLRQTAPGLFTMNGQRLAAGAFVLRDTAGNVSQQDLFDCSSGICRERTIRFPANLDQAVLILYGTGWRNSPSNPLVRITNNSAEVLYSGPQPEFPGLDQININWRSEWKGRFTLILESDSVRSNPLEFTIE